MSFWKEVFKEGQEKGHKEGFVEGHEEGCIEGHKKGFTEGEQQGIKRIVLAMKNKLKVTEISELTNIPIEEVLEILKEAEE